AGQGVSSPDQPAPQERRGREGHPPEQGVYEARAREQQGREPGLPYQLHAAPYAALRSWTWATLCDSIQLRISSWASMPVDQSSRNPSISMSACSAMSRVTTGALFTGPGTASSGRMGSMTPGAATTAMRPSLRRTVVPAG